MDCDIAIDVTVDQLRELMTSPTVAAVLDHLEEQWECGLLLSASSCVAAPYGSATMTACCKFASRRVSRLTNWSCNN